MSERDSIPDIALQLFGRPVEPESSETEPRSEAEPNEGDQDVPGEEIAAKHNELLAHLFEDSAAKLADREFFAMPGFRVPAGDDEASE